jgi:hypothetical protein
MATEKGKIVSGGMGGFLNPPTHPEHSIHVETDLRRRKENRGAMSLSSAAGCEWLNRETRHAARLRLNQWQRPPISDPSIQDWIYRVLGYFRNCYIRPFSTRKASDLLVSNSLNPLAHAHMHAGVAFVRNFYPEFHPSAKHFDSAYWGKKPV